MAVGQKRGSRAESTGASAAESTAESTELSAARDQGGWPDSPAVDGLLLRVAHGDAEAFAGVYDQVAGTVFGLVRRIVGDESRAEQVAADVLVEVWRSASRFRPVEGSGLNWIMTKARRRALRHVRAAGNDLPAESGPAYPGLASLPAPQREALLLASLGYTSRQVADLAGVPADTAAELLREGLLGLSSRPH